MCRLMKDDDGRTIGGHGKVHLESTSGGLKLLFEVTDVGFTGISQEREHVVVQAIGTCAVYHYV